MPRPSQLDPFRPSLALWITLGTLGSAMTMLVLLLILINNFSATYARKQAISEVQLMADNVVDTLKWRLEERVRDLSLLASWPNFHRQTTTEQAATLATMVEKTPYFEWLSLTDRNGTIRVASNPNLEGRQLPKHDGQLPSEQRITISAPHHQSAWLDDLEEESHSPLQYEIAIPLQRSGAPDGWLVASLSWHHTEKQVQTLLNHKSALDKADLLILDQAGKILLSSRKLPLLQLPASLLAQDGDHPSTPRRWPDGQLYITTVRNTAPLEGVQQPLWQIVVRRPVAIALQDFSRLQDQLALSALIAFCALSIAAVWLARKIASPLRAIRRALETPGNQLPHTRSYAEAELLANVITEMRQLEQQDIQALAHLNQTLESQVMERTDELNNILQHATYAFISINPHGDTIYWNRMAEEMLGWSAASRLGMRLPASLFAPETQAWFDELLTSLNSGENSKPISDHRELEVTTSQGLSIPVELTIWSSRAAEQFRINLILSDIRERKLAQQALVESQYRLQTITDNLPVLIASIDTNYCFRFANAALSRWYHIDLQAVIGKHIRDIMSPEVYALMAPYAEAALQGETQRVERQQRIQGQQRYMHSTLVPELDEYGNVEGFIILTQDITTRKQLELELQQQAHQDTLTGLPNRRAMEQQLPAALARADRIEQPMALLFMDLDGFKAVNDTWGHDAGDEVLRQFARRIRQQIRETDQLFRLAGDEFTLLLENLHHGEMDATRIAEKILSAMQTPFQLATTEVTLSSSIGIALYQPGILRDADSLLSAADGAMYQAKHAGKNRFVLAACAPPSPTA